MPYMTELADKAEKTEIEKWFTQFAAYYITYLLNPLWYDVSE